MYGMLTFPVPPENHDFPDFRYFRNHPPRLGVVLGQKWSKTKKLKKNWNSSEIFQNFRGGFTQIRLLATEHELFENRAKSIKSRKIHDFGSTIFALSVGSAQKKKM